MDRTAAVLATIAVGALVALQPPVNSQLARHATVIGAGFLSTAVAAVVMGCAWLVAGGHGSLPAVSDVPALYWTGGLMGALLVTVSLVTVRTLGAGGVVAATVFGQLAVSALIDRFGVLGLERIALTPARLLGLALLLAGTLLVSYR